LRDARELDLCARMMAGSEPWLTLRRDYAASRQAIDDPAKEVYLAEVAGTIVGFVVLTMAGAFVGYIQSICVAAEWRGRGVGTALLRHAEARILREVPNVFLCVSSFNPRARALYERLGYAVVGELRDYLVAGHAELLLRKTIGPLADFPGPPGRGSGPRGGDQR
jgi:ribosomal protein S18 acetylase RimI-like enzyme